MKTILVIDDDKPFRKAVTTTLRRQGYDVCDAGDGAEGLALACAQRPSLVLSDVNMPGKDGFELLKELRAQPSTSAIPVILMTGKPQTANARFSMDHGADDYLQKPFTMEQMLASVQARLERQSGIHRAVEVQFQAERLSAAEKIRLQTTALEAAANGIAITDRKGKILWVNAAFARLTGYSAEEAVGQNPRVLKSGQQPPKFYADMWATILTGNVWHGDLVNQRKDGSCYFEEMTITPVCGANGEIQNFIAIKQDVTARKQIEQALAHKRDLLQALMDNLPDHIYFKDASSCFTRVNLAMARHLGLEKTEDAIGMSDADFFSPHEARQKLVDERHLLATGEPILGLVEKSDTGNATQWVSSTKVPIRAADGKITGLVGISRDVTEGKRVEETLQRQQAELRALFDLMPALIWFKDTENRILRVNQRVAERAGKPVAEIEGRPSSEIYPQEAARFYADDLEVIQSGAPKLGYVETVPGPAGEERWVQTDKVPYCDKNGKVIGIVVMAQDITERKRADAALLESHRFLQSTLDALSSHIAILDEHGTIVEVNAAWKSFARENGLETGFGAGENYLDICDSAAGDFSEEASAVATGIRAVMAGQRDEFHLEYPCHSPQQPRWFTVRATRFDAAGPVRVVVAHENITERRRAEDELQWKTAFLEAQMHSSIDGILVVNEQGKKTLQNQRTTELLKIPQAIADDEDEEKQRRWVMQMVKTPGQFLEKILYLNSHRDEISRDELELMDGTILDRYSAPMTGGDGKYYGRMWTFRDITERRRTELERQMMELQIAPVAKTRIHRPARRRHRARNQHADAIRRRQHALRPRFL